MSAKQSVLRIGMDRGYDWAWSTPHVTRAGVYAALALVALALGCSGRAEESRAEEVPPSRAPRASRVTEPRGAETASGAPWTPREVALPAPAVWVQASQSRDGRTTVWFDEARHVSWSSSDPVRWNEPVHTPPRGWRGSALRWFREESYRSLPVGSDVVCTVDAKGGLTCRGYPCTSPAIYAGTQPPIRCRNLEPPWSRALSPVQRTHVFVPTHPWWRASRFDVRAEGAHVCLRREESIACYALRRGVTRPSPEPTPAIASLGPVLDLSGAGSTACAVIEDGTVHCWGAPFSPEPRTPDAADEALAAYRSDPVPPFVPHRIEGLPPAVQVAVGLRHACARTRDGRVFCWGDPQCIVDQVPPSRGAVDVPSENREN